MHPVQETHGRAAGTQIHRLVSHLSSQCNSTGFLGAVSLPAPCWHVNEEPKQRSGCLPAQAHLLERAAKDKMSSCIRAESAQVGATVLIKIPWIGAGPEKIYSTIHVQDSQPHHLDVQRSEQASKQATGTSHWCAEVPLWHTPLLRARGPSLPAGVTPSDLSIAPALDRQLCRRSSGVHFARPTYTAASAAERGH